MSDTEPQKNTTETQRATERTAPSACPPLAAPKPLFPTGGSLCNPLFSVVLFVSGVFSRRPMTSVDVGPPPVRYSATWAAIKVANATGLPCGLLRSTLRSSEREAPRGEPVASKRLWRQSERSGKREAPRHKAVATESVFGLSKNGTSRASICRKTARKRCGEFTYQRNAL